MPYRHQLLTLHFDVPCRFWGCQRRGPGYVNFLHWNLMSRDVLWTSEHWSDICHFLTSISDVGRIYWDIGNLDWHMTNFDIMATSVIDVILWHPPDGLHLNCTIQYVLHMGSDRPPVKLSKLIKIILKSEINKLQFRIKLYLNYNVIKYLFVQTIKP